MPKIASRTASTTPMTKPANRIEITLSILPVEYPGENGQQDGIDHDNEQAKRPNDEFAGEEHDEGAQECVEHAEEEARRQELQGYKARRRLDTRQKPQRNGHGKAIDQNMKMKKLPAPSENRTICSQSKRWMVSRT